ncbi:MAG: TonB-dependent receptor [Crocinitomicaceae bacterium]|nr:TonB-dependent receptor [Crocinitomicaceae bacterium]
MHLERSVILRSFISLLFFAFNVAFVYGQQCELRLSGQVLDNHDNSQLAYSNIYIDSLQKGTVSDANGYFKMEGLCKGHYTLRISHAECDPVFTHLYIDKDIQITFYLEHHLLEEIEISEKVEIGNVGKSTNEISGRNLNLLKSQNLGGILENINGVSSLKTGNSISKPIIHGLHSSRILILNNDIIQESQQWGQEHAPEVDPYALGVINLIKGAESVKYGPGAIGGVIIVRPKKLTDSAGIHGGVDLVFNSNGLGGSFNGEIEGMFKKTPGWSWRLQGSVKKLGNANTSYYYNSNTGVEEYNMSFNTLYKGKRWNLEVFYSMFNTKLGIFKGSHIGNLTDLEDAVKREKPLIQEGFKYDIARPFQKISHHLVKIGSKIQTGKEGELVLDFAYQRNNRNEYDSHKPYGGEFDDRAQMQFFLDGFYGNVHWEHAYKKGFKGKIGINYIGAANIYGGTSFLIPNYNKYGGGIYWIESLTIRRLKLEIGIRYDLRFFEYYYYDKQGGLQDPKKSWNNVSGNFGLQYRFNKQNSINWGITRAWRNPEANELFSNGLHHGAAAIEYGNEDLSAEISTGTSLSYKLDSKRIQFNIELYVNYMQNFIYMKPGEPELTIRGAFPTFHFDQNDAILTGGDLSLSFFPIEQFEININGSTLWAYNLDRQEYISMMPADRVGAFLKYRFKSSDKLSEPFVKLSGTGVSRQWKHSPEDDIYGVPGAYFLMNFESAITFIQKKGAVTLGFEVQNLLNTKYRDYMNRFRFYTDELGIGALIKISYTI